MNKQGGESSSNIYTVSIYISRASAIHIFKYKQSEIHEYVNLCNKTIAGQETTCSQIIPVSQFSLVRFMCRKCKLLPAHS